MGNKESLPSYLRHASSPRQKSRIIEDKALMTEEDSIPVPLNAAIDDSVVFDPLVLEYQINLHQTARSQRRPYESENPLGQEYMSMIDFTIPKTYPKTPKEIIFIENCLSSYFVFDTLSPEGKDGLIAGMRQECYPVSTVIISQGDEGDFFYVLEEGEVGISTDGKETGKYKKGAAFGELALIYNTPRRVTCVARNNCTVWKVCSKTFRTYMVKESSGDDQGDDTIIDTLNKVTLFKDFNIETLNTIVNALATVKYESGERIMTKGDVGTVFYIVKDGRVKLQNIGLGESNFIEVENGPGDYFGERALLTGEPRAATITAITKCTLLALSKGDFEKRLGPLRDVMERAMLNEIIMSIPIFANSFQSVEIECLLDSLFSIKLLRGTTLAEVGEVCEKAFYIIHSGIIILTGKDGTINTFKTGDHFMGWSIPVIEEYISDFTITVAKDAVCSKLTQGQVKEIIGSLGRLGKPKPELGHKLDATVGIHELQKLKIIGVGTYAKVWLCGTSYSKKVYALKVMSKLDLLTHNQAENAVRERNIMSSIRHPFVCRLINTFQDDYSLYLALKYVPGGELFDVMYRNKNFRHTGGPGLVPNHHATFYCACILEALSHLHHRHICYRDLTPENIVIDKDGYCVLVDFGFAKVVMDETFTLCGSPEYVAPEIVLSRGHNKGVDYWSLGVIIYEMLFGQYPFFMDGTDQGSLFRKICLVDFRYPDDTIHLAGQNLIDNLLVRKVSKRYGCFLDGARYIRQHEWFANVDFKNLLQKKVSAPWTPKLKDSLDTKYFPNYNHLDFGEMKRTKVDERYSAMFHGFTC